MRSSRVVTILLAATVTVFAAAGVYTAGMIRERQGRLESIFRYNVPYAASQTVIEFQRLRGALLEFARNRTEANLDEAKLRFEILYNRSGMFNDRDFAA